MDTSWASSAILDTFTTCIEKDDHNTLCRTVRLQALARALNVPGIGDDVFCQHWGGGGGGGGGGGAMNLEHTDLGL